VHRHVADIPIPTANPELLAVVESRLNTLISHNDDNDKLLTKTTQLIRQNLGTSICNIEGIAQALSLHPRALQRELKSHNTQFRDLLNKIRQETAEHYLLHSDISIADLSDMLGYQNPTAFTRAFKLNTGLPASRWQQYRAKNAP
jgi:AraC-like DNA-binding protein